MWIAYAVAALSFVTTLTLPYIGEEAIYTIAAMEMKVRGEYFVNTLYGTNHGQPPLLNWLIISLADSFGWQHVLVASRLIAACATTATGLVLAWLVTTLTQDARLAAFAALVYLTSDALLYHGWLAYTYPLFAFFAFGAMACLWIATVKKSITLTWVAVTLLSCAALTKGASAYPFYAAVALVLLWQRDLRAFLLRPGVIGPHLVAAGLYVLWHRHLIGSAQQSMDVTAVMEKLRAFDLRHYLIQLWSFPVELALRFVPASLLVAYCALRKRAGGAEAQPWARSFATAAWIALLGVLPYWLWPDTGSRYVLPLYALAAFLLAHLLWHQNLLRVRFVVNCLLAVIAVKYVAALWVFPAYLREHRGDYAALAADIEALTKGFALYATDVSATGLSVVANIDARRFPQQPLQWPPPEWSAGFVLANAENPEVGPIFRKYAVGGKPLYVLCRGEACAVRRTP